VTNLLEYRRSSDQGHGFPLFSPFPEWQELGRREAGRRARWRWRFAAPQRAGERMSVRESIRTGKPNGARDWVETNARGRILSPRPGQSAGAD
jgi:hypothetical protein